MKEKNYLIIAKTLENKHIFTKTVYCKRNREVQELCATIYQLFSGNVQIFVYKIKR